MKISTKKQKKILCYNFYTNIFCVYMSVKQWNQRLESSVTTKHHITTLCYQIQADLSATMQL